MQRSKAQLAIDKIRNLLRKLYVQARELDQNASQRNNSTSPKHQLFNQECFRSRSKLFLPYVTEIEKELQHAEQLLQQGQLSFLAFQVEKIELQCAAIIKAMNAKDSLKAIDKYRKDHLGKARFKQAMSRVLQPIQTLYAKLSETHEFERRLVAMLEEKQRHLNSTGNGPQSQLTQEILTLHQRLGRCRQAISMIERQIEQQEKQ
ncbi:primosomal replication protein PriC [Thalassotalea fusca]